MGFEPHQPPSKVEAVNEFTDQMKSTLEEAKPALAKVKDEMVRYYNQCLATAPTFAPGDKVYLSSSNIQMTCPLKNYCTVTLGLILLNATSDAIPTT